MELFVASPILFPLLGILLNVLIGKKLGERGVGWLASAVVVASFAVSLALFAQVAGDSEHAAVHVKVLPWISAGPLQVSWGLLVDPLSSVMMLIVTGIGALIHIYSIGYMHGDPRFQRFFVYLNLFIASMLTLVMADNFLVLFVGWELVGLCSYLLIGFWFTELKSAAAGRKAFVVNRIGDVGFVLGILAIFVTFGSLDFAEVFKAVKAQGGALAAAAGVITLLLFIGATGKSAQIPLFVWLPDAMAGPTPVSALIHAATMVTAGIYMMTRAHALFELAPFTQQIVALVGALTALVAGTSALRQLDIKRVLAYSTVSQLGFMVAAAGLGAYGASMFHLLTHAFFKALLFLAAGSVIHGMGHDHHTDPQDMRNMGGLARRMPVTFAAFVIGGLALAGVPPLSGFFSKDEILLAAFTHQPLTFLLLGVTAVVTALYVGRQLTLVFLGEPRTASAAHAHESPAVMTAPLMALAVGAVLGGALNLPGGGWLHHWLEPLIAEQAEPLNLPLAAFFTALSLLALAVAGWMYRRPERAAREAARGVGLFLARAWRIDDAYAQLVVKPFYFISTVCAQVVDVGLVDGAVNGVGNVFGRLAQLVRGLQTGLVRNYGLVMLLGAVLVTAYFVVVR
ncbi:MAG: NADH-quinone oxidoreductase subunit L [Thermoflexales bacterium]